MLKKIVKTGGESLGIRFTKQECDLYGIRENQILNVDEESIKEMKDVINFIGDYKK